MFMKRFLNSKRDKKAIITQLVLPLVMVLFGLLLITTIPTRDNDPPRVLKLSNLSVDGVHTKAFFADYRNLSSTVKKETLKKAETYLGDVKVDVQDITSKVYKIRDGNNGSNILVRDKSYSYKHDNESKSCCNFEYFVLNAKCKSIFISEDLKPDQCKDYTFGYNDCPKCIKANMYVLSFYSVKCALSFSVRSSFVQENSSHEQHPSLTEMLSSSIIISYRFSFSGSDFVLI